LQSARAFFGDIFQKSATRGSVHPCDGREEASAAVVELTKSAENHPCDGREEASAAVVELTKSAENETNNSVRLDPPLAPNS
jgi:hypothetical protein